MIRRPPKSPLFPYTTLSRSKDVFLQRQEYSRRIHQINGWDAVLDGDVLRADDLFRRHREEGAGLYRRIVRDDHKQPRSEEHTSELQSPCNLVCRLLLEKKK